jgi:hypothetical protein
MRRPPQCTWRLFSALTRRRHRPASFHSLVDLEVAIPGYIADHKGDPKRFTWTETPHWLLRRCTTLGSPENLQVPPMC